MSALMLAPVPESEFAQGVGLAISDRNKAVELTLILGGDLAALLVIYSLLEVGFEVLASGLPGVHVIEEALESAGTGAAAHASFASSSGGTRSSLGLQGQALLNQRPGQLDISAGHR